MGVNAWSLFKELNFQPVTDYEKEIMRQKNKISKKIGKIIYVI